MTGGPLRLSSRVRTVGLILTLIALACSLPLLYSAPATNAERALVDASSSAIAISPTRRVSDRIVSAPASATNTTFFGPLYDPAVWLPFSTQCVVLFTNATAQVCRRASWGHWFKLPQCSLGRWCAFWGAGRWKEPMAVPQSTPPAPQTQSPHDCPSLASARPPPFDDVHRAAGTLAVDDQGVLTSVHGCPIPPLSRQSTLDVLTAAARGKPILFSGDSIIRQIFHRLVNHLRGSNVSTDASPFHIDIVYVVGTKGDYFAPLPDSILELRGPKFEQSVGDEYKTNFSYSGLLRKARLNIGNPLLILHFLWNPFMYNPRYLPIRMLQPKLLVTSWNVWFRPNSSDTPANVQHLNASLAFYRHWLSKDRERRIVWPLGHRMKAIPLWERHNTWIAARNVLVARWHSELPLDLRRRFLLVDAEALQAKSVGLKFVDDIHYGTALKTACSAKRRVQNRMSTWCTAEEFRRGAKVLMTKYHGVAPDHFNSNLNRWMMELL